MNWLRISLANLCRYLVLWHWVGKWWNFHWRLSIRIIQVKQLKACTNNITIQSIFQKGIVGSVNNIFGIMIKLICKNIRAATMWSQIMKYWNKGVLSNLLPCICEEWPLDNCYNNVTRWLWWWLLIIIPVAAN